MIYACEICGKHYTQDKKKSKHVKCQGFCAKCYNEVLVKAFEKKEIKKVTRKKNNIRFN